MAVRLAWGIIADRDRGVWLAETGERVGARDRELPAGAAVVLGDKDGSARAVTAARKALAELIAAGGVVVAGAGIDLGAGFVSARLAGVVGDRRDAVLAALRILGTAEAGRLGERTATLVALFGVTATKPLGAEAERAIADGRWAALTLASAAADVLGPEQLVRVLGWEAPAGTDPIPAGAPSALAANLRRVLESYSGPKRLELLADLWQRVCDRRTSIAKRTRLLESQDLTIHDELWQRVQRHCEERVVAQAIGGPRRQPSMMDALRFLPTWDRFWKFYVEHLIQDAIAATVLLRTAVAVYERGVIDGIAAVRDQIGTAAGLLTRADIKRAKLHEAGRIHLPARPACQLHEIDSWLRQGQPMNAAFEEFVHLRLRTALAYGLVVNDLCHNLFCTQIPAETIPDRWDTASLRTWRSAVGYTDIRPPSTWNQHPYVQDAPAATLAERLAEDTEATERASDLLWYAELADAIVQVRGFERAEVELGYHLPHFVVDPVAPQPEPLTPRLDSIPLAVAGAAQLLSLGANAPARCRDWARLCDGLMSSGSVAEAIISEFEVAEPVLVHDGSVLPGTTTRIQIARSASRLAEWADFMGNCIAGPWYQDQAVRGQSILVALRDERDTIEINAELRSNGHGWLVNEIYGRFNAEPDTALEKAMRRWVLGLRAVNAEPEISEPEPPPTRIRRGKPNAVRELAPVLGETVRVVFDAAPGTLRVLTSVAAASDGDPKLLTALRRSSASRLEQLCAEALDSHRVGLSELWAAVNNRPLVATLAALDPALLARHPRLRALTADTPLPSKILRELVKAPELAMARSMDLVSLRLRGAIARMAMTDDPVFARALIRRPSPEVICPFAIAITSVIERPYPVAAISEPSSVTVTGFPVTALDDPGGPWERYLPAATEFGGGVERLWEQTAETGVLVPNSWLSSGGWQGLWGRSWSNTALARGCGSRPKACRDDGGSRSRTA